MYGNQVSRLKIDILKSKTYITLKPYIPFLEYQEYDVSVANSATHGITALKDRTYDAVLLNYDGPARKENLLSHIRNLHAHIPILLLTA